MSLTKAEVEEQEERKATLAYVRERFKPFNFIQPDCHPTLHAVPFLAYFGVAVTRQELYDYATSRNLRPPPIYDGKTEVVRDIWFFETSIEMMGKKFNYPLQLRMPLNADYQWNVALYSNFEVEEERLVDEDEARLVQMIREEMNIPKDREALWHYDGQSGSIEMRCRPWRLPSKRKIEEIRKIYAGYGVKLGPVVFNDTDVSMSQPKKWR